MRSFIAALASLALAASPILGAPTTLKALEKYKGDVKVGSYLVQLKDGVSKGAHLEWLTKELDSSSAITHDWDSSFLNGFAGKFDSNVLNLLRAHPDVANVAEDGLMSITSTVTQTDAPWGLARVSSTPKLTDQTDSDLNFTYTYDSTAGSGVDIYVVDTGIYTSHSDFGGRATWGATFGGYADADGHGHGTHVSGTAAGARFGIAKAASLFAVKVLSDQGSGYISDIVSGLDWVATQVSSTGRPSIATMSLGGSATTTLDSAVASLTSQGIHVTVAAGNNADDAGNYSPSRAPTANTIAASDITDTQASFSNYGAVVDLYAPGLDVTSAWIGGTTATNTISGTSMATPHVAGLIAYLIGLNGNSAPADISATLQDLSVKGALSGVTSGTVNYLAHNA